MEMDIDDPAEVILLVKERSGRMHAWKVEPANRAGFRIVDQNPARSIATITATGAFHRQSRAATDTSLMPAEIAAKELDR